MAWRVLRYDPKGSSKPNAITIDEYWSSLLSFTTLGRMYVGVAVIKVTSLHIIYSDGVPDG